MNLCIGWIFWYRYRHRIGGWRTPCRCRCRCRCGFRCILDDGIGIRIGRRG